MGSRIIYQYNENVLTCVWNLLGNFIFLPSSVLYSQFHTHNFFLPLFPLSLPSHGFSLSQAALSLKHTYTKFYILKEEYNIAAAPLSLSLSQTILPLTSRLDPLASLSLTPAPR